MSGPLSGIKVVDLSLLLPGPLCSMYLGDMGADVIKVENPRAADLTRYMGSRMESADKSYSESGMFLAINRNKRSVTINIKRDEGREVLFKLLGTADILLEGFRPGTLDDMGIGYKELSKRFPRLIYCAISGYGASGPYRDLAGHDGDYIAHSGLLGITGEKNGKPVLPGFQVADIGGGSLTALSSILAALYAREKTGRGQFLDISMMDGAFSFLSLHAGEFVASGLDPVRGGSPLSGSLPNYHVYECKDGRFVMLGALEERFFRGFLRRIDREGILDGIDLTKMSDLERLRPVLEEIFKSKTRDEWASLFTDPECCLAPVNSIKEAFEDKQLVDRGMVVTMQHPRLGPILMVGSPFRFSETACSYRLPPPAHGQDTDSVLAALGYDEAAREELRKKRAV